MKKKRSKGIKEVKGKPEASNMTGDYMLGYELGHRMGREEGYRQGYHDAMKRVLENNER